MPRVSIAIPTYNCGPYISKSIESLLGQTYGDFEMVISDNVSTDDTESICRGYERLDRRVRYVRRTDNIGGPGNFRYVFSLCSGEYHKWSTADDWWDPSFLEKAVAVLDARRDVVLCYPKTTKVDGDGVPIGPYEDNLDLQSDSPSERFTQLLQRIGLCNAHLGLIRRSAMARTGLIGPERNSDTHFLAELALLGKFVLLPEYLFFRRFHVESSSWDRASDVHQDLYYRPASRTDARLHTFAKYRRLLGVAVRTPLPASERMRLLALIGRCARWERHSMMRELLGVVHR